MALETIINDGMIMMMIVTIKQVHLVLYARLLSQYTIYISLLNSLNNP